MRYPARVEHGGAFECATLPAFYANAATGNAFVAVLAQSTGARSNALRHPRSTRTRLRGMRTRLRGMRTRLRLIDSEGVAQFVNHRVGHDGYVADGVRIDDRLGR